MRIRVFDIGPCATESGRTCLLVHPQMVRASDAKRKVARGTHSWVLIYWGASDINSPECVIRLASPRMTHLEERAECGLLRLATPPTPPSVYELAAMVRAQQRRNNIAATRLPDYNDSRMGLGRPVEPLLIREMLTYCHTGWVRAESVLAVHPCGEIGPALREAIIAAGGDARWLLRDGAKRGKAGGMCRSARDAQAYAAARGQ